MTDYEQSKAFGGVIDALEAIGAEYAIWGGLAVVAYGEPRFIQDLDILRSPAGFCVSYLYALWKRPFIDKAR
jgi:hypothetical protein